MPDEIEKRVYVAPVRVLNGQCPDPMGLKVWDWKDYVIQAANKVEAAFALLCHPRFGKDIEAAGGFIESTLEEYPYANERGIVVG